MPKADAFSAEQRSSNWINTRSCEAVPSGQASMVSVARHPTSGSCQLLAEAVAGRATLDQPWRNRLEASCLSDLNVIGRIYVKSSIPVPANLQTAITGRNYVTEYHAQGLIRDSGAKLEKLEAFQRAVVRHPEVTEVSGNKVVPQDLTYTELCMLASFEASGKTAAEARLWYISHHYGDVDAAGGDESQQVQLLIAATCSSERARQLVAQLPPRALDNLAEALDELVEGQLRGRVAARAARAATRVANAAAAGVAPAADSGESPNPLFGQYPSDAGMAPGASTGTDGTTRREPPAAAASAPGFKAAPSALSPPQVDRLGTVETGATTTTPPSMGTEPSGDNSDDEVEFTGHMDAFGNLVTPQVSQQTPLASNSAASSAPTPKSVNQRIRFKSDEEENRSDASGEETKSDMFAQLDKLVDTLKRRMTKPSRKVKAKKAKADGKPKTG